MTAPPLPWDVAHDEVQLATVYAALVKADGNISRAAAALRIHRSHISRLVKKFDLAGFAAELRLAAGSVRVGRPPRSRSAR